MMSLLERSGRFGDLLEFLSRLPDALNPMPAVVGDPALEEMAGPTATASARETARRRNLAARAAAVNKGATWFEMGPIGDAEAQEGYTSEIARAAQAAQLIKEQRRKDDQSTRLLDLIKQGSGLSEAQRTVLSAVSPEAAEDALVKQAFPTPDKRAPFTPIALGNGAVAIFDNQEGKVVEIVRDPNASAAVAGGDLNQQSLDLAAEQYRVTGKLPSLGMGKAAAALRLKIINRAAELAAAQGDTANAAVIRMQTNKAAQSALTTLQRQQTLVGAFEKTALKNLDLVLSLSKNVDRTGVPIINKALMHFLKNTHDVDTAPFVNALVAARTEYAKVLSGATGAQGITDAARKEAEELFSTATSPAALERVIAVAKQEMANRMESFDEERMSLAPYLSGTDNGPPSKETAAERLKRLQGAH